MHIFSVMSFFSSYFFFFFFFNDTATTEIYTLSLHDALPIYLAAARRRGRRGGRARRGGGHSVRHGPLHHGGSPTPRGVMRSALFAAVLALTRTAPAAAQTPTEPTIVLTFYAGAVTGHALWGIARQP